MITFSKLGKCGRLGNQLWQIASSAGIAQTLGQSVGFFDWDYRPFFRVPDEFFPETLKGHRLVQAQNTGLVNHMDPRCRDYLQDRHLWEAIAPQVWEWFQPSDYALEQAKNCFVSDVFRSPERFADLPRPILSVHVRRGDNANQPNNSHPLRPWSYFEESIAQVDGEFETLVVFSDDPEWCRTAFWDYGAKHEVAFFEGQPRKKEHEVGYRTDPFKDWLDLQLMSKCDLHVISNSSYSWWAAFLSHNPSPIYPWPFMGTDLDYIDCGLMMPEAWTRIDHGQQYV